MIEITKGGKVISRSKNLRSVRHRCRTHEVRHVNIREGEPADVPKSIRSRVKPGEGELYILWQDGAKVVVRFASFKVLEDFIRRQRCLRGVKLYVNQSFERRLK